MATPGILILQTTSDNKNKLQLQQWQRQQNIWDIFPTHTHRHTHTSVKWTFAGPRYLFITGVALQEH